MPESAQVVPNEDAPPPLGRSGRLGRLAVSLGDQALVSGTNFATGILIGRACTEQQLGIYAMAFGVVLVLTEVHHALIATPQQVLYPRHRGEDRRQFNGSTLLHSVTLAAASAVVLGAIGLSLRGQPIGPVFFAAAVAIGLYLPRQYGRLFCYTARIPKAALALDAIGSFAQLATLVGLIVMDRLTPVTALLSIGLANGAAAIVWYLASRQHFHAKPRLALADVRRTWPLSRWVFVSGLIWTLGMHTYPLLIGLLRSEREAGIWFACFAIGALANPLLMGIQNIAGPAVAHAHADRADSDFRRFVIKASIGFAVAMVPFAVGAALFGEQFLRLYGGEFAGYGSVVSLLAVSTITHAIGFPSSRALLAINRARHDLVGNVIALAFLATFGLWLINRFGVAGAAISLVLSEAAGNGYRVIVFLACNPVDDRAEVPQPDESPTGMAVA